MWFFCAAVARLDRASMKPPRFDSSWAEDMQALYRHDMQDFWNQHYNQPDLCRYLFKIGAGN